MNLNRYANLSIMISFMYAAVVFFMENQITAYFSNQKTLLWITVSLTAVNMLMLTSLFCSGKLNITVILLNFAQITIFCLLYIQIQHISYNAHTPLSLSTNDGYRFAVLHLLNSFDFIDIMECYCPDFQKFSPKNTSERIVSFSMCFTEGIFFMGIIFSEIRQFPKVEKVITVKKWLGFSGLTILITMGIAVSLKNLNMEDRFMWILDNILHIADFGDAFQIFGWHFYSPKTDMISPAKNILFRLAVSVWLIIFLYHYLYLSALEESVRDRIEELIEFINSCELSARKIIAVEELKKHGNLAEPAIPSLIKLLESDNKYVRRAAANALKEINPQWTQTKIAQEALINFFDLLINSKFISTRIARAEAIGEFGRQAKKLVPDLIKVLDNEKEKPVRNAVSQALVKIGLTAFPDLLDIINNPMKNQNVRAEAAHVTAKIGSDHPGKVVPKMVKSLNSKDMETKKLAGEILKEMGPEAVPVLIEMLKNKQTPGLIVEAFTKIRMTSDILSRLFELLLKDNSLQKSIVRILSGIVPDSDIDVDKGVLEAVKSFIAALKHEQIQIRINAIEALKNIKYRSRIAIPALVDVMLNDKEELVRKKAKEALEEIILEPFSIFDLIKKLKDGKEDKETERSDAARTLGEIGPPEAEKAIPDLIKALADEDEKVRYEAARALRRIDSEWRRHKCLATLIPCFIEAMGQVDVEFPCKMPQEALEETGDAAVRYLVESLIHANTSVVDKDLEFLETYHPDWTNSSGAVKAIPCLIKGLKNDQWYIRCNAALVLGEIGWSARQALPHLILALADRNKNVRDTAKKSMSKIVLERKRNDLKWFRSSKNPGAVSISEQLDCR